MMQTPRQTNLINHDLGPKKQALSPRLVTVMMGCTLAGLAVLCLTVFLIQSVQESDISAIKTQNASLREKIGGLSPQVVEAQKGLELKISEADRQIAVSRQLLSTLGAIQSQTGGQQSARHAEVLKALSRFESNSLWLAKIQFDPEKELLELSGKTTNSNDIVSYIQFLSTQTNFKGMKFDQVDVHADEKIAGLWLFAITNQKISKAVGVGK